MMAVICLLYLNMDVAVPFKPYVCSERFTRRMDRALGKLKAIVLQDQDISPLIHRGKIPVAAILAWVEEGRKG